MSGFQRSFALMALALAAQPVGAARNNAIRFEADLTGKAYPDVTGSEATGHAVFVLHPDRETVDLTLDVKGLNRDALWDRLVAAPVGPMHVHLYMPDGDVELIMAFPFGKAYKDTKDGLRLRAMKIAYPANAGLVKSNRSFADFTAALRSGNAYLNIHTDKFNDGEIAGKIGETTQR